MKPEDVIDLDAYPIADRNDPARTKLINKLKADLSENQYCSLPGFIRPAALERAVREAKAERARAH
ncbi:MAG: hypothetical protein ACR2OM_14330, partial [Aestuariivirgaceae bacterium]